MTSFRYAWCPLSMCGEVTWSHEYLQSWRLPQAALCGVCAGLRADRDRCSSGTQDCQLESVTENCKVDKTLYFSISPGIRWRHIMVFTGLGRHSLFISCGLQTVTLNKELRMSWMGHSHAFRKQESPRNMAPVMETRSEINLYTVLLWGPVIANI